VVVGQSPGRPGSCLVCVVGGRGSAVCTAPAESEPDCRGSAPPAPSAQGFPPSSRSSRERRGPGRRIRPAGRRRPTQPCRRRAGRAAHRGARAVASRNGACPAPYGAALTHVGLARGQSGAEVSGSSAHPGPQSQLRLTPWCQRRPQHRRRWDPVAGEAAGGEVLRAQPRRKLEYSQASSCGPAHSMPHRVSRATEATGLRTPLNAPWAGNRRNRSTCVLPLRRVFFPYLARIPHRPAQGIICTRPTPRLRLVQLPVVPAVVAPVHRGLRMDRLRLGRQHRPIRARTAVSTAHTLQLPGIPHAFDRAPHCRHAGRERAGRTGAYGQHPVPAPANSPSSSPHPFQATPFWERITLYRGTNAGDPGRLLQGRGPRSWPVSANGSWPRWCWPTTPVVTSPAARSADRRPSGSRPRAGRSRTGERQ
jgi:hypothetical protein